MFSNTEKFILACVLIGIPLIIGAAFYCDSLTKEQHRLDAIKCENRGGVQLDRTYTSGKSTGHIYTCVRSDIIVDTDKGSF